MGYRLTLIPGDGIGPEVTNAARLVGEATGVSLDWEVAEAGEKAIQATGSPLPDEVLRSIRKNRIALKGPITTPIGGGFRSVNVALRQQLDLFASVRPARAIAGEGTRFPETDLIVVREATEGLYSGVEHWVDREHSAAETVAIVTRKASDRIIRFAFELARREKRHHVTAVHKANIMKTTGGLFQTAFREIAPQYPDIVADERLIDNMCMQLAKKPEEYRRTGHDESLRRHLVRPLRGTRGGTGRSSRSVVRGRARGVRTGARLGAQVRRSGQGGPGCRDPLSGASAPSPRRDRGRGPSLPGRLGNDRREEGRHVRPRLAGLHRAARLAVVVQRDGEGDRAQGPPRRPAFSAPETEGNGGGPRPSPRGLIGRFFLGPTYAGSPTTLTITRFGRRPSNSA